MMYIQNRPQSAWVSMGYQAAKAGVAFDAVKSTSKIANGWIQQGMKKWERRAAKLRAQEESHAKTPLVD